MKITKLTLNTSFLSSQRWKCSRPPWDDLESYETPVYRWASSGGGWRSMVAGMAFGNVFSQAGLLSPNRRQLLHPCRLFLEQAGFLRAF